MLNDRLVRYQAANLPRDIRDAIDSELAQWNDIFRRVECLIPGQQEPDRIIEKLKAGAAIVNSLKAQLGPVHGWTLGAYHALWQQAQRLLPKERSDFTHTPGWTERF